MVSRKKITSSKADSTGSTEIIQQYLFDSDSNLPSLSEVSFSEKVAIVMMKEFCQKQMRKLLLSLMEILSVTNLYLKMLNLLVIKIVLPLPPAVQRNVKLLKMKKVTKRKRLVYMMKWNSKKTLRNMRH